MGALLRIGCNTAWLSTRTRPDAGFFFMSGLKSPPSHARSSSRAAVWCNCRFVTLQGAGALPCLSCSRSSCPGRRRRRRVTATVNSSIRLSLLCPGHFDAGTSIFAQFVAQTAKRDVENFRCMSSIAAAVSKRKNDMRSYDLGQCGVIFYHRHDITLISVPSCQPPK
jgi:hypothetical protein